MTRRGEVLVSILNNLPDMTLALARHWYRIPSDSVSKFLKNSWPPKWLAFYQTKVFGSEAYAVNYYARVGTIREVCRWELFPDQPEDSKSQRRYYKLELSRCHAWNSQLSAGGCGGLHSSQLPGKNLPAHLRLTIYGMKAP